MAYIDVSECVSNTSRKFKEPRPATGIEEAITRTIFPRQRNHGGDRGFGGRVASVTQSISSNMRVAARSVTDINSGMTDIMQATRSVDESTPKVRGFARTGVRQRRLAKLPGEMSDTRHFEVSLCDHLPGVRGGIAATEAPACSGASGPSPRNRPVALSAKQRAAFVKPSTGERL